LASLEKLAPLRARGAGEGGAAGLVFRASPTLTLGDPSQQPKSCARVCGGLFLETGTLVVPGARRNPQSRLVPSRTKEILPLTALLRKWPRARLFPESIAFSRLEPSSWRPVHYGTEKLSDAAAKKGDA